jgi:hypothetical protein
MAASSSAATAAALDTWWDDVNNSPLWWDRTFHALAALYGVIAVAPRRVLVAGVSEGGGGVARKFLRDDVVLLVLLVGVEGLCSVGLTARASGGGA